MKKLITAIAIVFMMVLAACGGTPTVSELLEETIAAHEKLESYTTAIEMEAEAGGFKFSIDAKGDTTHDPDTMYMEMTMKMMGISVDLEAYVADDEMYMGMFDTWFVVEDDEMDLGDFDELTQEQLDGLEELADNFEMTEEDGYYVLTLSGEGETFEKFMQEFLEASMSDMTDDLGFDEDFGDFNVKSLEVELKIKKDSKIIESQTLSAELEMDGETLTLDAEITISNVGEIEPIEIPEEVKDEAVTEGEFDEMFGLVDDFDDDFEDDFMDEWLTLDEIKEMVDYTIPEPTNLPEDYEMTDTFYDDYFDSVHIFYEKDFYNMLMLSVYPSTDVYDDIWFDETTDEKVTVNGTEAVLEALDEYTMFVTWVDGDITIELLGEGPDMTKEILLEVAESIK